MRERVRRLLERAGLPTAAPASAPARCSSTCAIDKKVLGGRVRLVLLRAHRRRPSSRADYPRRGARRARSAPHCGERAVNDAIPASALAPYAAQDEHSRGRRFPEPPPAVPQRIPARPRPHHPLQRVPPPGLQDAGVRQPRGRPVPHAPHPFDRGGADRALDRARAAPERGADRGDLPGARPRPHALRARRPGRAQRVHARVRRLRAQPAVAARRR